MGSSFNVGKSSKQQGSERKTGSSAKTPQRRPANRFSLLEQLEGRRLLSGTYIVSNTDDSGAGSLRAAILAAKSDTNSLIKFALGSGSHTISLTDALPTITSSVTIDGNTQPGYTNAPLIYLDGSGVKDHGSGTIGLEIDAAGVTVRGLGIDGFTNAQIHLGGAGGDTIQGDWLGLNSSGVLANPGIGISIGSSNNLIGGAAAADRNVISGNAWDGILVTADGNQIIGNFIGTDTTGTQNLANNNNGITIEGAGNTTIVGNLVSGNNGYGIDFENCTFGGNLVAGNYIGTDITGKFRISNTVDGVHLFDSSLITIGGNTAPPSDLLGGNVSSNAGNLISGNAADGVHIEDSSSNIVSGNYIGTDITGTQSIDGNGENLGNDGNGVTIVSNNADAAGNIIGGTTAGQRNLISNSSGDGVSIATLSDGAANNIVEGNYIGTDVSGTHSLQNFGNGITILGTGAVIGGSSSGAGNLISGNHLFGIKLQASGLVVIQGNRIGTQADGTDPLADGSGGIFVDGSNDTIGGTGAGDANIIAFNGGNGVSISNGNKNRIRGNAIFSNGGLGIDLGASGVTVNDSKGHTGANLYQNFPVITNVTNTGGVITIAGSLSTGAAGTYTLDFYSSAAADPTGYGEGQMYLGSVTVSTASNGTATFSVSFSVVSGQTVVAATATDANGNTSEFSHTAAIPAAPTIASTTTTLSSSANPSAFGQTITLTATVTGSTPTGSVVFMDGSTVLGTATVNSSGVAVLNVSTLSVSSGHTITATYGGDTNNAGSSASLTQVVNKVSTATTLASSANPSVYGQSVTLTATVTGSTPTGSVVFMDGSTVLGTATVNSSGVAVLNVSALSVSSGHTITATYGGDANNASSSASLTQVVNKVSTTTSLASSTNPSVYGQSVTFTATVTGSTPTGSVVFMDGSTVLGTATVNSSGVAVLNVSTLSVSSGHTITATYSGDANNAGSSASLSQVVNKLSTSTTLVSSADPSVYGQSVTFTATVTGAGMPTGSVVFMDGTTVLGTATLNNGVATLALSNLSVSGHPITATYGGDTNDSGSTGSLNQAVNKDNTSTTLTSSAASTSFGQSVTFTATVAIQTPGSGTATGSVIFMEGTTVLGTATLNSSGVATLTLSTLSVGAHSITATYTADTNDSASTSAPVGLMVNQLSTNTTLASSANPSVYGQSVTLTATVTGSGPLTGSVVFMDGTTVLGSASINSTGVATLTLSSLAVSSHTITATYGGDTNDAGSSVSLTQAVNKDSTTTSLTSSASSTSVGQSITFTATVAVVNPGSGTPSGSVVFMDGTTVLGTGTVNSSGVATLTVSTLAVGGHSVTANYVGDANDNASASAAVAVAVNQLATSTTIASSVNPSAHGQSVMFTATVTGSGALTGSVVFMDGDTVLGTASINSSGVASLTVSSLDVSEHAITASYGGDTNDAGSSASLTQAVNQNHTATTLISSAGSVSFGQSVTFTSSVALADVGSGTPTGSVMFMDGTTVLGTGTLDANGVAKLTLSTLSTGDHSVTAIYSGDVNDIASASAPVDVIVNQLSTSTSLVSSADPSVFGQSITFTATVTGSGTPTGNVIFMDGSTVLGSGTLDGNGVATLTLSNLSVSGHPITAIYGGDTNNAGSNGSLSQVVNKDHTSTTLTVSSSSTTYGHSVTFTAKVSLADLGAGTPAGLVTFMDGTTVLGTASVGADGTAVLTTSSLAVGNHSITAVYSGDEDFASSTSAPLSEAVNTIATSTTLSSSANPSVSGQTVTLTATVSAQDGSVPTGSVLFMDGTTVLGTATVDGNGVATLTVSTLSVGGHAVTAAYSGDANDAGSSASLSQNVQKSHTGTTLVSSASSTTYGQAITFTATVAISDLGSGMPTGLVTFMDGTTVLGTGTLNAQGVATLTVSNLAVGSHSITASYAGNATFTSSISGPVSESVNLIETATTLVSSMASSSYGDSVTFTATVIGASGDVPTGSVVFMDGTTVLGTGMLDSNGMATLTLSGLTVGSHSITATYGGSATDAESDASLTQMVGKDNTATTLTSTADPSVYGQAVTLTATVTGSGHVSGDIVFMDGTTVLGTAAIDSHGMASITLSSLSVGGHEITASYAGDATNSGSSASLTQNVNKDKTTTTLVLSATTVNYGQSVVFTATVDIADLGSGNPTGFVTFMDGTTVVGTASLGANGVASFTTSTQSVGGHVLTAVYSGDGNFAGSISNAVNEAVHMLGTSTSLSSSTDPSSHGQSVLFTATVNGGANPTGTITFSDGATVLGTVAVSANGTATLLVSTLTTGGHPITATYSGDVDNAGSSASLTQIVNKNSTATTLSSSSASVTYGQSITFTATVSLTSAGSGTPTGNVVFMDGSTVLGTVAVDGNGKATLSVSSLSVGGHAITATYSGDANDTGSSASLAQSVTKRATTTVLASSLNPSVYKQNVTFTATVSSGAGALSGSVVFMDGSTVLGTGALNSSGVATLTVSSLSAGSHGVTATYSGDANDAGSTGSITQGVSKDVTATTLVSSANPSTYGQSVTFTATLTNVSVGGPLAGSIVFMDGSTVLGTVAVDSSGVATLTVSSLSVSAHTITASYAGDANDAASNAALNQTVNKVGTTTTLASTSNPSVYGQAITLTATVAGNSPTGSVNFMDGSTVLGTISLSSGKANLTLSSLSVAGHSITATYSGDTRNMGSSASLTQTVNKDKTSTTLVSSAGSITTAQSVTFTATVKLNDVGAGTPTGNVTFKDGSTVLGTASVNASGVATLTVSSMTAGTHAITAVYAGDANFVTSTSGPLSECVTAALASVSGHTYNDVTGNGLSADDTLMSGVTVQLYQDKNASGTLDSADGSAISAVITGANGAYSFGSLAKGTYFVQEVTPSGYVRTAPALSSIYTMALNGNTVINDDFDNYHTCTCSNDLTNVIYTVNGHTYTDLRSAVVHQGDTVKATFTVPSGKHETISLVSYTAPANTFDANTASQQQVYNYVTGSYGPGTYTVSVKVPPCDFQVDFVCGDVIDTFGPANSNIFYSAQSRLISANNGGVNPPNNVTPINSPNDPLA